MPNRPCRFPTTGWCWNKARPASKTPRRISSPTRASRNSFSAAASLRRSASRNGAQVEPSDLILRRPCFSRGRLEGWPQARSRLGPSFETPTFGRLLRTRLMGNGYCMLGWPSRPGEFHPEPLTDPDLNLSIHPARVTARRLPPSAEPSGSSRFDPVGPRSTTMTHPLRSMGIAPLRRYYEAVRPSPAHRYFQPHGWSRLCFFPWHRRPGSHVPYKSLVELRAASMPDAAWAVSVHPPS